MFKTMYRNDKIGYQQSQRLRIGAQIMAFLSFGGGVIYEDHLKSQRLKQQRAALIESETLSMGSENNGDSLQ